jgi:hypothetical protein
MHLVHIFFAGIFSHKLTIVNSRNVSFKNELKCCPYFFHPALCSLLHFTVDELAVNGKEVTDDVAR